MNITRIWQQCQKLSVRKVAEKYNIPRSTLAEHKLGRFQCGPALKPTTRTPDSLDRARVLAATPEAIEKFFCLFGNILAK